MISQIALNHVPYWVVDAVGAPTAVLLAFTVAHAALPAHDFKAPDRAPPPAAAALALPATPAGPAPAFVFGRPVEGFEIISPFGLRQLPWEEGGRLHAGVDIAAPAGLPARAVADGVVTRTGRDGGYGRFVEVRHDGGLKTLYAHLGSVGAVAGARVYRGSEIGRVGSTGSSTGSHLHFEVRGAKGQPLNPSYFIDAEYAAAADLPLKEASRIPHGVRRAYVSFIPQIRREQMQAREQAKLDAALAAKAAKDTAKPRAPDTARVQFALNTATRPVGVFLPARATATLKLEPVRSMALLVKPEPAKPAAPAPKPALSAQAALNAAVFARDSEIIQTANGF
jgi:hypothetical protein